MNAFAKIASLVVTGLLLTNTTHTTPICFKIAHVSISNCTIEINLGQSSDDDNDDNEKSYQLTFDNDDDQDALSLLNKVLTAE